ncbi:hypothetical protein BWI93_11620 [Siphonobacter sp. BAB-5385]|uniref:site-specific integrase n=1 Tax=Siphonobacter sp. BAB-5385 TaxID=1864822 RepID=UPI000B9E9972|nr:site-specific integrase [Siphonobacter sp. BAB-5385]OZI07997.1 hypothetical protein BWI93_11620 [Siphonobacter sp. BAB-5385]
MQISRWIDKTKIDKSGAAPIMITITYQGQRSRFSSKYKIEPKYWNDAKEIIKGSAAFAEVVNQRLEEWSVIIRLAWHHLESPFGKVDKQAFETLIENLWITWDKIKADTSGDLKLEQKRLLDETLQGQKPQILLSDFWTIYDQDHAAIHQHSFLRKFRSVRDHLEAYKPDIDFKDFTLSFFNRYVNFLAGEQDLADATIESNIKKIKSLLKYADITGVAVPKDYALFKFTSANPDRVFLRWNEVMQLWDYHFHIDEDRMVADQFLTACFTGFRYSDLIKLGQSYSQSKEIPVFALRQQKTRESVSVALNDYAAEIWKRYDGTLFNEENLLSPQKFNVALKTVARRAKIDAATKVTEFKKGKALETFVPKYEVISSHTGRHTFAVNSIEKGMPLEVLQKILGHQNIQSTLVYAKIVDEFKHQTMLEVWKKK